jgi:hypothetical protein
MARYFHGGANAIDVQKLSATATTEERKEQIKRETAQHYPLSQPAENSLVMKNGEVHLKVPPMYWREKTQTFFTNGGTVNVPGIDADSTTVPFKPGMVIFASGSKEGGFHVCEPDGFVDIPDWITVEQVKAAAPHLLTEKEAIARGIAAAPATPKKTSKLA